MEKKGAQRDQLPELLEHHGGLRVGVAGDVSAQTGVPEADVYGVASFYTLLAQPDAGVRVCQGLSCQLAGTEARAQELAAVGTPFTKVSCLGQCDRAPVALDPTLELLAWGGAGTVTSANSDLPMNLAGADDASYSALKQARERGAEALLAELKASGLQGRGGAGFPAHIKWQAVRNERELERFVVVNADESEPGTFKDRELLLRRPHLVLEGAAIAAWFAKASVVYLYLRGEFTDCRRRLETAVAEAQPHLGDLEIRLSLGHGAYICGEETALLEAIEGKRGMPRHKPPFPTQRGLFGKPTLMNNVETLACVPSIVKRGGDWFRAQGRTEAGTKLYCISGHVERPGVYELPLGVTLDELVQAAGGYVGTPKAFSPGGAASGFLPITKRDVPLDMGHLKAEGSMLGSAGVVVLNDTVDMAQAALWQQIFFEDETCGQCAPCRIGCSLQRQALEGYVGDRSVPSRLDAVEDVHWEMEEGSICGLGVTASLPLVTAMRHFPEDFGRSEP
ncbi:MAG: NADH-ubiquinone oxidoreductase-F iron-sulfur binding region domain-containing protein [Myxococcota bacterium]